MDEIVSTLLGNATATAILFAVGITITIVSAILFVVAFFQGREVSFWPPKIGPRPFEPRPMQTREPPTAVSDPRPLSQKRQIGQAEEAVVNIGFPQQRAGEPDVSWWAIPIFLGKSSSVKSLEGCHVFLLMAFDEHQLRWQSDDVRGSAEVTLRIGEDPKIVPIAMRCEQSWDSPWGRIPARTAILTDESFLVHRQLVPLLPRHHTVDIEIRSFDKRWRKKFVIDVPEGQHTNGHFIMRPLDGFFEEQFG